MTEAMSRQPERQGLNISDFIHELEQIAPRPGPDGKEIGDRAAMASLRRGLGKEPHEVPAQFFAVALPLLPTDLPDRTARIAYLVASLFAFSSPDPSHRGWRGNLGASLRKLDEDIDSQGPERRFIALLNSDETDLPHHLRGVIGLLKSAEDPIPINWRQLTSDLLFWSHPERKVQHRWATAFWRGRRATESTDEQTESETTE